MFSIFVAYIFLQKKILLFRTNYGENVPQCNANATGFVAATMANDLEPLSRFSPLLPTLHYAIKCAC